MIFEHSNKDHVPADCMRNALRYLRPLNWGKVNPGNHQKFFQGILRRRELYMKVFQIIMENNTTHCPEIKGKKYGLAQIFLDLISDTYNESVISEIDEIKGDPISVIPIGHNNLIILQHFKVTSWGWIHLDIPEYFPLPIDMPQDAIRIHNFVFQSQEKYISVIVGR